MTTFFIWLFLISSGLLVYGFLIYPSILLIAGKGKRKHPAKQMDESLPSVSLVIAAYNEESVLKRKLQNALEIDYPASKLEIFLGSDGSDDATDSIAREFDDTPIQYIPYSQRRGKPSVLNDTIGRCSGELLFLCDANVMFEPGALRELVAHFSDESVGAVTGDVRLESEDADFGEGESAYYRVERAIQLGESRMGSVMGVDGGMYVVRRELFEPLPAEVLNEEFLVTMRAIRKGYRIAYEPDAIASETATPTAKQEWRRRVRISAGTIQLLAGKVWPPIGRPIEFWQFVSHKLIRWCNPYLLMTTLISSVFLARVHWFFGVVLAAQLLFYGLALLATFSLRLRATTLGGITFYFTMSHIAMAVGNSKGLLKRQSALWKQADRGVVKEPTL